MTADLKVVQVQSLERMHATIRVDRRHAEAVGLRADRVASRRVDVVIQNPPCAAHHVHQPHVQLAHHGVARDEDVHLLALQGLQHLRRRDGQRSGGNP